MTAGPQDAEARAPGSAPQPEAEDARLGVARVAEFAFFLITVFFALGLSSDGDPAERMVLARLLLEATAALAVFLAMGLRPRAARVGALVLAAFVLVGCLGNLVRIPGALMHTDASGIMALALVAASCICQLVVFFACFPARRPRSDD